MALKSINPFTDEIIAEFEEHSEDQVNEILSKSEKAFRDWKSTSLQKRATLTQKLADILRQNKDEYARTITLEMGKAITESKAEIEKCAWVCDYYAENAETQLAPEIIETDAHLSRVQYEPLGTILGIMPWNFPFWQAFRFLVPTVTAGNIALLKHSSNVQACAALIEKTFIDAGFPADIVKNLVINSKKVKPIIKHNGVKAITLTGSEFAGSAVAAIAGENIKKTVLELGGSNAFIVLADADIDKAVETGITARMMNCGQSCIAAKRFLIHESLFNAFTERYKNSIDKLVVGDPLNETTQIGPLSSRKQAEEVALQVQKSVTMGAKVVIGGSKKDCFYSPTLLTEVTTDMPVFKEEVFGPVASAISFRTEEEAIQLANQSRFGLGASIFTTDIKKAEQLIPQIEDGAVFINTLVKSDPRLPFGGTKKSGYGRELALHGIREFVNAKTVYFSS